MQEKGKFLRLLRVTYYFLAICALVLVSLAAQDKAAFRYYRQYALPDSRYTPGEVRSSDSGEVCTTTTKQFRHTTGAEKKAVCGLYGVTPCPHAKTLELDHLIPLELGGADAKDNLWPQKAPDFHFKDKLENELHRLVCTGKVSLADAQKEISEDWTKSYEVRIGRLP